MNQQRRKTPDLGTVRPGSRRAGRPRFLPAAFVAVALFANLVLFIDWVESKTSWDSRVYLQVSTLPGNLVAAAPAAASEAEPATEIAATGPVTESVAVDALVQDASEPEVSAAAVETTEATPIVAVQESQAAAGLAGRRIWAGGDSMAFYVAKSLLSLASAEGAVAVHTGDAVVSSGLNSPGFFDWPAYLAAEMAEHDPDVVVFMVGANDAKPGMDLDAYHARVGALMDALEGREVIWVGQPSFDPTIRPDLATSIPAANEVFFLEALTRPWVTYVDTWTPSTDAARAYARYLPDESGSLVEIRAGDGIHLTPAGGERLARVILGHLLD